VVVAEEAVEAEAAAEALLVVVVVVVAVEAPAAAPAQVPRPRPVVKHVMVQGQHVHMEEATTAVVLQYRTQPVAGQPRD
jgi:hypothetical protein